MAYSADLVKAKMTQITRTNTFQTQCELCHEECDDGDRRPVVLKCAHVLCVPCTKHMLCVRQKPSCPKCKFPIGLQSRIERIPKPV